MYIKHKNIYLIFNIHGILAIYQIKCSISMNTNSFSFHEIEDEKEKLREQKKQNEERPDW